MESTPNMSSGCGGKGMSKCMQEAKRVFIVEMRMELNLEGVDIYSE